MEEIFRASSSSSSSSSLWSSLCSRIPSKSPLMTAELMDWSTFISLSLTSSSSSVLPSLLWSSTTTVRGLDVDAGGEPIKLRPGPKVSADQLTVLEEAAVASAECGVPPGGEHFLGVWVLSAEGGVGSCGSDDAGS